MKTNSYRDLIVWQKSILLVEEVYKITRELPKSEVYGLASQLQRASVAIPSNIAEGYNRGHSKEYIQFLSIAYGSGAEVETQLIIFEKLYPDIKCETAKNLNLEILKMLNALINKLKS